MKVRIIKMYLTKKSKKLERKEIVILIVTRALNSLLM